jgi:hypothetical protein
VGGFGGGGGGGDLVDPGCVGQLRDGLMRPHKEFSDLKGGGGGLGATWDDAFRGNIGEGDGRAPWIDQGSKML